MLTILLLTFRDYSFSDAGRVIPTASGYLPCQQYFDQQQCLATLRHNKEQTADILVCVESDHGPCQQHGLGHSQEQEGQGSGDDEERRVEGGHPGDIARVHGDIDVVTWCRSSKEMMTTENLFWSESNPPWPPSPSYKHRCPR